MDFNIKDLRENPSQEEVFDAEQAINLKIFQPLMRLRHGASVVTHESGARGEDPPRPFHTWGLK